MDHKNLTVDEIQRQLQKLQQNQADLERALEKRRQEGRQEVAQEVKDLIASRGYGVNDILPLLTTRRRRGPGKVSQLVKTLGRANTKYVDPDNPKNVYVRGVIPGWMKQKMEERGYDPKVKDHRDEFKANYLTAVER